MATLFPSFVSEEDIVTLLEKVTKDELQEILHSFKRQKPQPRWMANRLFLRFYEVLVGKSLKGSQGIWGFW